MLRFIPKQQETQENQEEKIKDILSKLPSKDFPELPERLLKLLIDREIDTPEKIIKYLNPDRNNPEHFYDPMRMQDMDKAVAVIQDALKKNEEITIFGDYDVDGVTATAILWTYLRKQNAKVNTYIPDRHGEGYGLNEKAIEEIAGHSKLLITVDCGITCAKEVAQAKKLGMRVIVTDHHQLGTELPQCEAVLNPLLGNYPFRRLCGAGVAFKLVQALGGMKAIEKLWELAALATIADIVPLVDENRVIVYYGLKDMQKTERPGLIALMESAGVEQKKVNSSDVAFRMAPRINAGGRLASASRGVELLTTTKLDKARKIAEELNQDNTKRRELELEIFQKADEMTRSEIDFMKERAIVICGDDWNPGVIGLAASRLVEKYKWPTVLLSYNGENCVGSARSIPGVNIHEAMNTCCDLFIRFGGHAQAAGLTISKENVPEFRKRLSKAINSQIKDSPETFIPTEEFDLELELSEITEELVKGFDRMQPTGFGNAAPVFCLRGVHTTEIRTIGKESAHLRMKLAQGNELRSAIGFRMGDKLNSMPEVIDAIVGLSINEWQGKRTVQCELKQVQPYMPGKAFIEECKRQVNRFDYAMLDAMELEGTETSNIEKMPLVQAEALLKEAFHESYQGVLIGVHTLAAMKLLNVHLAVMHAQLDYVIGETADIRGFNTLVIAPKWEKIAFKPRIIVALDGFLSDGERMAAKKCFPNARIIEVTDMRSQASSAAERLLPTDDELRNLYRELRRRARTDCTLNVLTEASGLNEEGKTIAGLKILNELHLIEYTLKPLSWKILPSGKVLLENSKFRARMIQMKNEGRKLI